MYRFCVKRFLDICFSILAIVVLSPFFVLFSLFGLFAMKGNPFFTQERPGKNEKIFKLVKFRTMSNECDLSGNLLPDDMRLNMYGNFLRSTSLDELPELLNILKGDMSFVGPRPLLVEYIPLYNEAQHHRHDVRPGLTGLAQINGRNIISWESKFRHDLEYIQKMSFLFDAAIVFHTFLKVLKREGINAENQATMHKFTGSAK